MSIMLTQKHHIKHKSDPSIKYVQFIHFSHCSDYYRCCGISICIGSDKPFKSAQTELLRMHHGNRSRYTLNCALHGDGWRVNRRGNTTSEIGGNSSNFLAVISNIAHKSSPSDFKRSPRGNDCKLLTRTLTDQPTPSTPIHITSSLLEEKWIKNLYSNTSNQRGK
jgi:hypothetical protein